MATRRNYTTIGYQGENKWDTITISIADLVKKYPGGYAYLYVVRAGDDEGYIPRNVEQTENALLWTPDDYDTEYDGILKAQAMYVVNGDVVGKTQIFIFNIDQSLTSFATRPATYEDWVNGLLQAATNVNSEIDAAEATLDGAVEAARAAQAAAVAAQTAAERAQHTAENAKSSSAQSANAAYNYAADANRAKRDAVTAKNDAVQAKGDAELAKTAAENAKDSANTSSLKSEGYAVGTQDGVAAGEGEPYFHDNAKYYKELAEAAKTDAIAAKNRAEEVVDGIEKAGDEQVTRVTGTGSAQVQAVTAEGTTQVGNVQTKGQQVLNSIPADYTQLSENVDELKSAVNNFKGGTTGQILRKKSNVDYDIEWANVGAPTDAQVETAVDTWLDEHPEATTTVQDGSIALKKFSIDALPFVTPEMFGAVGDGQTDDSDSIQAAIDFCILHAKTLRFMRKTYGVLPKQEYKVVLQHSSAIHALLISGEVDIDLNGATIQLLENDVACVYIIGVWAVNRGSIKNGTIIGDGLTFTNRGTSWDSSKGINLFESKNFVIDNVIVKDTKGDCIGIGGVQKGQAYTTIEFEDYYMNILVKNCIFTNGYRCGLTMGKYRGVTFENCSFEKSTGISPAAGIDIEPYYGYGNGFDCTFINCNVLDNTIGVFVQSVTNTKFIGCDMQGITCRNTDDVMISESTLRNIYAAHSSLSVDHCKIGTNPKSETITVAALSSAFPEGMKKPSIEIRNSNIIGTVTGQAGTEYKYDKLEIKKCNLYSEKQNVFLLQYTSKLFDIGVLIEDNDIKLVTDSISGAALAKISFEKVVIRNNKFVVDAKTAYATSSLLGIFTNNAGIEILDNDIEIERNAFENYVNIWGNMLAFTTPLKLPISFIGNRFNKYNINTLTRNDLKFYIAIDKGDQSGNVALLIVDNYLYGITGLTPDTSEKVVFTANYNNIVNNIAT